MSCLYILRCPYFRVWGSTSCSTPVTYTQLDSGEIRGYIICVGPQPVLALSGFCFSTDDPPLSPPVTLKEDKRGDQKGYETYTVMAGYVQSQDGLWWHRLWYQLKLDLCLYKFKSQEVATYIENVNHVSRE